jgi:hypothetical protein
VGHKPQENSLNQQRPVVDHFNQPAIFNRNNANKTVVETYGTHLVEYKYNSTGYRTHEFINTTSPYIVVFGSSHTQGVGLDDKDRWTTHLEELTGLPVFAVADGGNSSKIILKNLSNWLLSDMPTPAAIILQWPPTHRLYVWKNSNRIDITAANPSPPFNELLKLGEENFWVDYVDNIILADQLCKSAGIQNLHMIIDSSNIMVEQVSTITKQAGIDLLIDEKVPGKTWMFDNGALDNSHHSGQCHRQWAERVHALLK